MRCDAIRCVTMRPNSRPNPNSCLSSTFRTGSLLLSMLHAHTQCHNFRFISEMNALVWVSWTSSPSNRFSQFQPHMFVNDEHDIVAEMFAVHYSLLWKLKCVLMYEICGQNKFDKLSPSSAIRSRILVRLPTAQSWRLKSFASRVAWYNAQQYFRNYLDVCRTVWALLVGNSPWLIMFSVC